MKFYAGLDVGGASHGPGLIEEPGEQRVAPLTELHTAVVGQLGVPALVGGVAIGATVFSLLFWTFGFLRLGTSGMTAQAFGRRDPAEIAATLQRALLIAIAAGLYPPGHPAHHMTIGTHEDIQAAKLDDVRQFFRKYYSPNNASLAIVGDVDVAQVRELVTKYFGTLKRGPEVQPVSVTCSCAPRPHAPRWA